MPVPLAEVAGDLGISLSFAEQLAAPLRESGLIRSFRGPNGGYVPAKPAEEISILSVILAVQHTSRIGPKCDSGTALAPILERMAVMQQSVLRHIRLSDLIEGLEQETILSCAATASGTGRSNP